MVRIASLLAGTTLLVVANPAFAQASPGQAGSQTGTRAEAEAEPAAPGPGDAGITQAQADSAPGDGDIVVTAQKRSERLTSIPLAVTAIGGDALASRQINDSATLTQAVPSLTFQQGSNPTNTSFRIRGVGTSLFGQGIESSASVVVDGVVAARQAQGFTDLADVERIEVLRGPQGTLFGRNASAGVINVVTARPSSTFGGRADFTIAEHGEYRAKGTVTGPITDTLKARLTGYYNNVDGFVRNLTTGRDVQGSEGYGVRGKLDWDPTGNLNILVTGEYRKQDSLCCASVPVSLVTPGVVQLTRPVVASPRNRQIVENEETYANTWQWTGSIQADLDLDFATLTSITAYQKYHLDVNQPIDRTNSSPILFVGTGAAYSATDLNAGILNLRQFSQELRLGSNGGGDLTYVIGAYYNHTDVERPFQRRRARCLAGTLYQPCAATNLVYQSSRSFAELVTESYALFGQAEYRLVGGLKAIGGVRVQHESGRNTGTQFGALVAGDQLFPGSPGLVNAATTGSAQAEDTAVTGKAGLQYEFSRDAQVYATYTRGYKGQGYNTEAATDFRNQTVLEPEHVNAYEAGFKFVTADRKFSLNAAAFLSDYSNLQVQANRSDPVTGTVVFTPVNAGSSRTKGIEIESVLRPSRSFSIAASFTLSDSRITIAGLNCPLQQQAAAPVLTGAFPVNSCYRPRISVNGVLTTLGPIQDLRNAPLPASPKYRVNISPRYEHAIPGTGLEGFAQVSVNFQSDQNFTLEQDPLTRQDAYTLVDASIGIRDAEDRYTLTLFVKNMFNTNYFTSLGHNSLLATAANPFDIVGTFNKDADRYFGATLGFRF
ncbi:TonB-dependent receptor [Sphingomonas aracearum]|uniref:TonB-dependent receptor n=1 Tax=Sphingomonas aracearum TaxID=2283317 RepID=A0A369VTV8_9SPHN|nr:TonB-dependent receptor [Sphingomonas aracearum]RDE04967.1 TonB-dependent receptor [Sphingomonas aracearum]